MTDPSLFASSLNLLFLLIKYEFSVQYNLKRPHLFIILHSSCALVKQICSEQNLLKSFSFHNNLAVFFALFKFIVTTERPDLIASCKPVT